MTQHQWDLIGYGVWALIIWVTLKQFAQTRKEITGSGLKLLLGDWLMFASLPWLFYCIGTRATEEQIGLTIGLGAVAAIPYVLTSRFEMVRPGVAKFKQNPLFYLFLFGFPYVRYVIRDHVFHSHPILMPTHRPDIELMLAEYIAVLVIYTFLWRLWMFLSYRRTISTDFRSAVNGQHIISNGGE